MECLLYYMSKKAPEQAEVDKAQNDEHNAYLAAIEDLRQHIEHRKAPSPEALEAVTSFIDAKTGDVETVDSFLNTVLSWEKKSDA
jgi:hypothetical protein